MIHTKHIKQIAWKNCTIEQNVIYIRTSPKTWPLWIDESDLNGHVIVLGVLSYTFMYTVI